MNRCHAVWYWLRSWIEQYPSPSSLCPAVFFPHEILNRKYPPPSKQAVVNIVVALAVVVVIIIIVVVANSSSKRLAVGVGAGLVHIYIYTYTYVELLFVGRFLFNQCCFSHRWGDGPLHTWTGDTLEWAVGLAWWLMVAAYEVYPKSLSL